MAVPLSLVCRLPLLVFLAVGSLRAQNGYDSGDYPPRLVEKLELDRADPAPRIGTWLRIRGMANAPVLEARSVEHGARSSAGEPEAIAEVERVRAALARLRAAGYRSSCMVRWDKAWASGKRAGTGPGTRAPLDLREAHARARALAETYGDLVDAWEFENEPDIGFVSENADVFTAYYKAVALGIAEGRARAWARAQNDRATGGRGSAGQGESAKERQRDGLDGGAEEVFPRSVDLSVIPPLSLPAASLVVMPAMALPPGPFLEQCLANGFLSYTEGANLHYYGFAENYADAHARLREALQRAKPQEGDGTVIAGERGLGHPGSSGPPARRAVSPIRLPSSPALQPRRLPVFVTEWGYPRLDGVAAQTVEGRVRQWRFYRDLQATNEHLGVAAPMAFYLPPYYEYGAKEFGLTMPSREKRAAHYGFEAEDLDWPQKSAKDAKQAGVPGDQKPGGTGGPAVGGGNTPARQNDGATERTEGKKGGLGSDPVALFRPPGEGPSAKPPAPFANIGAPGRVARAVRLLHPATLPRAIPCCCTPLSPPEVFTAGGLAFTPADFGAAKTEPWMRRIGERIGDAEASPALAWLMTEAEERRTQAPTKTPGRAASFAGLSAKGAWPVRTEAASMVVADFVAGEGTTAVKNFHGYFLQGTERDAAGARLRTGRGKLVLYNFGRSVAELRSSWPEGMNADGEEVAARAWHVTLAPGERREIAVKLSVPDEQFRAVERRLAIEVREGGDPRARPAVSRWATRVYPSPDAHAPKEARSFFFPAAEAEANREWLETRPHAEEEARLQRDGRWLVTPGVRVEETASGWRFHVEAFPDAPMRPAVAELPLPDAWAPWEPGLLFSYRHRIAPASFALRTPLRADAPEQTKRLQTGKMGDVIESYLRTRTGNLYSTQPRLAPLPEWQRYNQLAETLSVQFPGRIKPPLSLHAHRPASLVFFLRPTGLPTVFEVETPRLAHWLRVEGK